MEGNETKGGAREREIDGASNGRAAPLGGGGWVVGGRRAKTSKRSPINERLTMSKGKTKGNVRVGWEVRKFVGGDTTDGVIRDRAAPLRLNINKRI